MIGHAPPALRAGLHTMTTPLPAAALAQLFYDARTVQRFADTPVSRETLTQLYDLVRHGPTGFNAQPARFVFVQRIEAKALLAPALSARNRERVLAAPATVLIAWDSCFHEALPRLFPGFDARGFFDSHPALIELSATSNTALQTGYLILAARALGLAVAPMSGLDTAAVDAAFFPDGRWRTLWIASLGYGLADDLPPRLPRLALDEAVTFR